MTHGQAEPGPDPGTEPRPSPKQGVARRIGRYDVVKELGRGAMGHVYMARQREIQRLVAIKVMRPDMADEVAARRFRREAEMMARLRHPGIVPVFDFGSHGKTPYFVMDYVEGQSLAEPIRKGIRFTHRQILEIVRDLALALHHAHQQGIIHRDLKPSNVLLTTDGRPVVTDFGLAADQLRPANLTATGFVVGTPLYMAPEQATGKGPVDALSDIYSLGVILFELLTGWNPRNAQSVGSVMRKAARDPLPAPSSIEPSVPPGFDTMTLRATSHDRSQRHATAQQLASQAEALLQHLGSDNQLAPSATLAIPEGASGPLSAAPPGMEPASGPPRGREYLDRERPLRPVRSQRQTRALVTAGLSVSALILLALGVLSSLSSNTTNPVSSEQRLREERLKARQKRQIEQRHQDEQLLAEQRQQEQRTLQRSLIDNGQACLAKTDGAQECLELLSNTELEVKGLAEFHALRARALTMTGATDAAEAAWAQAFETQPSLVLDYIHSELLSGYQRRAGRLFEWLDRASQTEDAPANDVAKAVWETRQDGPSGLRIARRMLDEVIMAYPDDPTARRERALIHWQLGEWSKALLDAKTLATQWPDDARHHAIYGRFLRSHRRWGAAREAFTRAISLRPDLPGPLMEQGQLGLETFQIPEARQNFVRAARLAPHSVIPILGEARALLLSSFGAGARKQLKIRSVMRRRLEILQQARALDLDNPLLQVELGFASGLLDARTRGVFQLQNPHSYLDAALAAAPRETEVHRLRVFLHLQEGNSEFRSFQTDLDELIGRWQAVTPDHVEPWLSAGELASVAGKRKLSEALVGQAFAAEPEDPQAWLRVASFQLPRRDNPSLDPQVQSLIKSLGHAWGNSPELLNSWSLYHDRRTDVLQTALKALGGVKALLRQRQSVVINQKDALDEAYGLWDAGDPERALDKLLFCASMEPSSPLPHGRVVDWVLTHQPIVDSIDEGQRLELALRHGRLAVESCETSGYVEYLPWALAHRALAEFTNGHLEVGAQSFRRANVQLNQRRVPWHDEFDSEAKTVLLAINREWGIPFTAPGPDENSGR